MTAAAEIMLGGFGGARTAFSNNTFALNQSGDRVAWVFKAADNATITKLGFHATGKTGTATTWIISLQGVSGTDGTPDGTIKGGGSPASLTFTNSSVLTSTWNWLTLSNSYACSAGEDLAIVLAYDSGTAPSAGVNDLTVTQTQDWPPQSNTPYSLSDNNVGSWTKSNIFPVYGYASSTTAFGKPQTGTVAYNYNSGSSPAIYGVRFSLPAGWGSTFEVAGVRVSFVPPTAGTTSMNIKLYDSDASTVLQSVTVDTEMFPGTGTLLAYFYFDEATLATLNFGTTYYLTFEPTTATNIGLRGFAVAAITDWDAWEGGQNFSAGSLSGGTWTATTINRLFCDLILRDWTEPAGSGGGLRLAGVGGLAAGG